MTAEERWSKERQRGLAMAYKDLEIARIDVQAARTAMIWWRRGIYLASVVLMVSMALIVLISPHWAWLGAVATVFGFISILAVNDNYTDLRKLRRKELEADAEYTQRQLG